MVEAQSEEHAKSHAHAQKGTEKKATVAARSRVSAKSALLRQKLKKEFQAIGKEFAIVAKKLEAASKAHSEQSLASVSSYMIRNHQKLAAEATKVRVDAEKMVSMWKKIAASKHSKKAREEAEIKVAEWQALMNEAKRLESTSKAMAVDISGAEEKAGSATGARGLKVVGASGTQGTSGHAGHTSPHRP
eukprot:gnl/TRDRNA2_/TRDRNA2_176578_c4_seq28.p1 gnl/TRDRNA2_/TRDRNA2_176578_c4~~gnl/TRDRNA2_/TRDRNA2_176578_c4_seq28.p1  ORF type:complete len:212 (+),score=46.53 gnl/TRDRNA2_/TRDRNA2_176578_c4_seq28:72-638(+)